MSPTASPPSKSAIVLSRSRAAAWSRTAARTICCAVQQLAIHTIGGVVTPAQVLMVIVPDSGGLMVEAEIENKDVGFVHVGQRADVKIEAFTFTRYGLIEGTVIGLSRDVAMDPEQTRSSSNAADDPEHPANQPKEAGYVAQIKLDRDWMDTETGREMLGPGMTVTAEIKTERRRIIDYLLSPVASMLRRAGMRDNRARLIDPTWTINLLIQSCSRSSRKSLMKEIKKPLIMGLTLFFLANAAIFLSGLFLGYSAALGANEGAIPQIKIKEKISLWDLGLGSFVKNLSFSPDSRYLAIVDEPNIATSTLIIWDLELDREQTRIKGLPPYGDWPQVEPTWSPDGKSITFGNGGLGFPILFWDPITGKLEKKLKIEKPALFSRYNKDGTKLLINTTPIINNPKNRGFRIYNTRDWTFKDFLVPEISTQTLFWTSDDQVGVVGYWGSHYPGTIDGVAMRHADVVLRLISPEGRTASRSAVIDHGVPLPGYPDRFMSGAFIALSALTNNFVHRVVLGLGPTKIIDYRTLQTLFTYSPSLEDIRSGRAVGGVAGVAFSGDGKYLFMLGGSRYADSHSLILNSKDGLPVGTFPGGKMGLAVSPDGKTLAVGTGHSVTIFAIDPQN